MMPELAMGLDRNPVQDPASGPLSFRPNPAAHPEDAIGFREARGGGRDHWHTGLSRSFGAQDELRMKGDAKELASTWALPMMRQHSWPPMGHVQGHTGTAGNIIAKAYPAIGHNTATHGEGRSSPGQLSQAQCLESVPAMLQQDRGPRFHDLPVPTANVLAPLLRASPRSTQASASHVGAGNAGGTGASPAPGRHAAAHGSPEVLHKFPWAPPLSLGGLADAGAGARGSFMADDMPWHDKTTAQDATNTDTKDAVTNTDTEDAAINLLPFTFEHALGILSDHPLPPGFHMLDE